MVFRDIQSDGTVRLTGGVYTAETVVETPPYEATFTFAIPSDTWTINHDRNEFLSIDIFDNNGDPVEADVRYPNRNSIIVSFYSPMTGYANIYD